MGDKSKEALSQPRDHLLNFEASILYFEWVKLHTSYLVGGLDMESTSLLGCLQAVKCVAVVMLDWNVYHGDLCQGDAQTSLRGRRELQVHSNISAEPG